MTDTESKTGRELDLEALTRPGGLVPVDVETTAQLVRRVLRLTTALEEIRDHWANQYDHPRKQGPMYAGSYGIGVTDGHRACAIIATKALAQG